MLGRGLVDGLADDAYAVDWVQNADQAIAAIAAHDYALLLLDLGLPDMFGLDLLDYLRDERRMPPTIVLTAYDSVDVCVQGLDTGANDYIVKPFSTAELKARIRAAMRRTQPASDPVLRCGAVRLDPCTGRASVGDACTAVQLSKREYALFNALMRHPGAIMSREQLESQIYGWGEEVESNAIEYLIRRVRQKLGTEVIHNVRGLGWLVSDPS